MDYLFLYIGAIALLFLCLICFANHKNTLFSAEQKKVLKNQEDFHILDTIIKPTYDLQTLVPLTKCSHCDIIAPYAEYIDGTKCACGGHFYNFEDGIFIHNFVFIQK